MIDSRTRAHRRRRRRIFAVVGLVLAVTSLVAAALPRRSQACVGMTVTIGFKDSPELEMAARIVSTLINERTGTATELEPVADLEALERKLAAGEIGIALLPLGFAVDQLTARGQVAEGDAFAFVRERYRLDDGLLWLDGLGFDAPSGTGWLSSGPMSPVSPVLHHEVVEDFPAMPRLVAKLAARIPADALATGVEQVDAGEKARNVARRFLEDERLI